MVFILSCDHSEYTAVATVMHLTFQTLRVLQQWCLELVSKSQSFQSINHCGNMIICKCHHNIITPSTPSIKASIIFSSELQMEKDIGITTKLSTHPLQAGKQKYN